MDEVLGFGLSGLQPEICSSTDDAETARIEALLSERRAAKAARDFARADEIRDRLAAEGISIKDTPETTLWEKR